MNTRVLKKLFLSLGFLYYLWPVAAATVKVDVERISPDTVVISWAYAGIPEPDEIHIYLYEGFSKVFPPEKIDALNGEARLWYFVKSPRNFFLGFDIRKLDFLFSKTVWTPGEIYTIGVQLIYTDPATQKQSSVKDYNYFFPFSIEAGEEGAIADGSVKLDKMPASFATFLQDGKFGIPANEKQSLPYSIITKVEESEDAFVLYLESGTKIIYEQAPKRPNVLGDRGVLIYPLIVLILVLLVCILFGGYLHLNAISIKAAMANELYGVDKKRVLLTFMDKQMGATYILFYLAKYLDREKQETEQWIKKIKLAFRKYRLFQKNEIKETIGEMITSNQLFQGMDSKKIFISYNHKDQVTAKKIKEHLEAQNFEVIIDVEAMKTGEDIETFIKKCIKQSAVTLSLISSNSLVSAWVAMETNFSFYDEILRGKYFMPCNIDTEFFAKDFGDKAMDKIEIEINELKKIMTRRLEKGRGIEDLQLELTRYNKLYNELPTILAKLKNSLCTDLSPANFDTGMAQVIKDIQSFYTEKL